MTRPFRPREIYAAQCNCGALIESETVEAQCGVCGLLVRFDWQAEGAK